MAALTPEVWGFGLLTSLKNEGKKPTKSPDPLPEAVFDFFYMMVHLCVIAEIKHLLLIPVEREM